MAFFVKCRETGCLMRSMLSQYILPDYQNCNLNISATLSAYLGGSSRNVQLPVLRDILAQGYEKTVFICFDGLGMVPIETHLNPEDFLRKHICQELTSTFPSTTTNATTSLLTNRLPLEHGWFGWSMYFPELSRNIDVFRGKDSMTRDKIDLPESILDRFPYYFDEAKGNHTIHTVFPPYISAAYSQRNHVYFSEDGFFQEIETICSQTGRHFVYAYFQEPDSIMHACGVSSTEACSVIRRLSDRMGEICEKSENILFIITADHGQIDINGYVELYQDQKLMDMLNIYPYLECRAVSFSVKNSYCDYFASYFSEKYHDDFLIFKVSDLVDMHLFGDRGHTANLLGDFLAIGTYTHKQALLFPGQRRVKGHHASLTEEMRVPLILAGR